MRTPERALARKRRYRRRLRSRIILSFVLLGFGLTTLFAFATNWTRNRVENALVEDVMNRNIDEYAHRFYSNPGENPAVPVEQIRARVVKRSEAHTSELQSLMRISYAVFCLNKTTNTTICRRLTE